MKFASMVAVLGTALVLVACGGGGGGSTAPGIPITSTSQDLGTAGGAVSLQGLSLTLPAASLASSVTVGLQQETVPSPALARFRFSPAGQVLNSPAQLRYSAANLPANVRFFWEVNGEQWMIPGTVSGGVLSAQISSLGYTGNGTFKVAAAAVQASALKATFARAFALAGTTPEGGSVVVQPVDCDTHITALKTRLARAASEGDPNRALGIQEDLKATREACSAVRAAELQQASCDALALAQANAPVFIASDLTEFRRLTIPLLSAQAFVETTGAACSNANKADNIGLIDAKFNQLLDIMKGQMSRSEFDDTLTVRDLGVVLNLDAMCQTLGLDAICTRLSSELYPNLLDALRASAFNDCRTNGNPLPVSQFYGLGSLANDPDNFYFHGRFSLAAVEADLNYCSNPSLGLRVFDGEAVPGELTDRATTLSPLVSMGNYVKQKAIEVPRDGSLNIAGTVGVLRCPDGSASGAELVFRINGQQWIRRAASGNGYPLENAPLLLNLPTVLPGFGIDPASNTGFTVTVNREGGACSDGAETILDAPFTLFSILVNQPNSGAFTGTLTFSQTSNFSQTQGTSPSNLNTNTRTGTTTFSADVVLVGTTRLMLTSINADSTLTEGSTSVSQAGLEGDNCRYIRTETRQRIFRSVSNSPSAADHAAFTFNATNNTWALENLIFNASVSGSESNSSSYANTANCEGFDTSSSASETPISPYTAGLTINFHDNTSPSGYLTGVITRGVNGLRRVQYIGSFQNTSGGVTTTTTLTLNLNELP